MQQYYAHLSSIICRYFKKVLYKDQYTIDPDPPKGDLIKIGRKLVTFYVHTLRIGNRILVDREQLDLRLHDEDREILI